MPNDGRRAYDIRSAASAYDVSDETIRRAIHSGMLRAKRQSRNNRGAGVGKYLISGEALDDWFESLPDA